jgi:hypothetical protein
MQVFTLHFIFYRKSLSWVAGLSRLAEIGRGDPRVNLKSQVLSAAEVAGPTGRLEPIGAREVPPAGMGRSPFLQRVLSAGKSGS